MITRYSLHHSKLKIQFLKDNFDHVIKAYKEHENQSGLIEVWAAADYSLQSLKFENVKFWRKRFKTLPAEPVPGRKVVDLKWIYGQVMWSSDHTIWFFKYPLLEYDGGKDYLNTLELISDN